MSTIYDFLPDAYGSSDLVVLKSLIDALDEQDAAILSVSAEARKELFITTATGRYLVSLASQYGFVIPRWAGLDTNGIRQLAIPSIFLPKQSKDTFRHIVESFYSRDIVHPSFICATFEPYALVDGDSINFKTETSEVSVTFRASQVSNISSCKAGELVSIINAQQTAVYADVMFDRIANASRIRITANSYGVEASLRVSGGSAQNILKFPSVKDVQGAAGTTWEITKQDGKSYSDVVIFTYQSGFNPALQALDIGDVLTIRSFADQVGPSTQTIPFSLLNGSYEILDCGMVTPTVGYFKVSNLMFQLPDLESFPVSYAQTSAIDLVFTSSVPRTVYNNREYALITEPGIGDVTVSVPPVPPITRTYLEGSMHLHGNKVQMIGFTRKTIKLNGIVNAGDNGGEAAYESKNTIEQFQKDKRYRYTSAGLDSGNTVLNLIGNQALTNFMPFVDAVECEEEFTQNGIHSPVYLELDSSIVKVVTPTVPSAFEPGHEIAIEGVDFTPEFGSVVISLDGGFSNSEFNKTHIVRSVYGKYVYYIEMLDSDGNPKRYGGAVVSGFDIYSLAVPQKGADIIFRFASEADRIQAGFTNGMKVRAEKYGTISNNVMANYLRDVALVVMYQTDTDVYLSSGHFRIFDGLILTGGRCRRSAFIGNSTFRHYIVDPFSGTPVNWNRDHWYRDPSIIFLNAPAHDNLDYVGSFVYDPIGTYDPIVVSGISTTFDYNDPPTNIRPFVVREREAPGILTVSSIENFPPQGQIVVGYGSPKMEGPISYTSYSGTGPYKLFIDKAYVFSFTHGPGSEVRLIRSSSPIQLSDKADDLPTYVVDAMSARDLVEDVLYEVSASGIKIAVQAQVPSLRFDEPEIDPFISRARQ